MSLENVVRRTLDKLPQLLTSLPLGWDKVEKDHQDTVVVMSVHCCLNGPVGVNKLTVFPCLEGQHKIVEFVKTTNSSWKGFCRNVALIIKDINPNIDCSMKRAIGDYWPLKDYNPKGHV